MVLNEQKAWKNIHKLSDIAEVLGKWMNLDKNKVTNRGSLVIKKYFSNYLILIFLKILKGWARYLKEKNINK